MKRTIFFATGIFAIALAFAIFNFNTTSNASTFAGFADKFNSQAVDTEPQTDETAGAYNFDRAHTYIGFRIKHFGLNEIPGAFRDFNGTINYEPKEVTKSSVEFSAKVTSIDTGIAPRDNHLRTADFFEVEKFPDMTFKSTKVEKKGKNLLVTGDFTLKGITKQITIPFTMLGVIKDGRGNMHIGIAATTMLNRQDYGVKWSQKLDNGSLAVDDMVKVDLQIDAAMKKK
ncbi:MAG: YceI family protein [Acidobacteriota bacterium]|nr:YceI family protein [Acidobacteriota bacterium]